MIFHEAKTNYLNHHKIQNNHLTCFSDRKFLEVNVSAFCGRVVCALSSLPDCAFDIYPLTLLRSMQFDQM